MSKSVFFTIIMFCVSISILSTSDSSKKWQGKADLLTQLESQVKRMKENFDSKERSLLEERDKATEAQKYDTRITSEQKCLFVNLLFCYILGLCVCSYHSLS